MVVVQADSIELHIRRIKIVNLVSTFNQDSNFSPKMSTRLTLANWIMDLFVRVLALLKIFDSFGIILFSYKRMSSKKILIESAIRVIGMEAIELQI